MIPTETAPMNGWNDDTRCVATKQVPQLQAIAASAKHEKRMAEKSAHRTSVQSAAKVSSPPSTNVALRWLHSWQHLHFAAPYSL